jgi:hypothetical protein
MAQQIWFGIPGTKMQWCPAPAAGAQVSNVGFVQTMPFENGGADVVRSSQTRKQYTFNFNAPSKDLDGISVYSKYASGFYGDGLVYFADPFAFETNLFPPAWASPALIEQGWENIYDTTPDFIDATPSNSYSQPFKTPMWVVNTATVNGVPTTANGVAYIPIPPTHTLHIGVSGSSNSSASIVRVVPINTDGTDATGINLNLLSNTGSVRMNKHFDGSSYQAVKVYVTRTALTFSTISITSMMAQLYPTGTSPVLPTSHMHGEGHTGLIFTDEARVENYTYIDPPRKGMNTTLLEVGAWR